MSNNAPVLAGVVATHGLAVFTIVVLRRALARARFEASHDALTGLPNRIAADSALAAAVRRGQPACVALLDLDDFKAINDCHGHEAGDRVLKVVAERISALGRFQLVARLHGDEFLLLADGDLECCVNAARAAAHTVAQEVHLNDGARVCPHSSIGVAPMQQGITAGQWCRNADTAMYQAKRARTAVWAYHTDLKPRQQASGADDPRPARASSRH